MKQDQKTVSQLCQVLTENDYKVSATCLMLEDYIKCLPDSARRILDLGCGYGGILRLVGAYFGTDELVGVDSNTSVGATICHDLNVTPYPIDSGFDLIICNGVIEHLHWFDPLLSEAYRLLDNGGHLLITLPNMANWFHRISLLLGYQPSDIAISRKLTRNTGTLIWCGVNNYDHIRTATVGAMKKLLEYYGFNIIKIRKGNPSLKNIHANSSGRYDKWEWLSKIINICVPVTMARRMIILARK